MTKEELMKLVSVENLTESFASNRVFDTVNLSEDVKGSFVAVVDNAVNKLVESNLDKMAEALIEANQTLVEEKIKEGVDAEMLVVSESMNDFCEGVADKYLEENKEVAVNNIKSKMFESMFAGVVDLARNHNVVIDEEKIDVVDELMDELQENKDAITHLSAAYASVKYQLDETKKENVISKYTTGLTEEQAAAIREITESTNFSVEFDSIVESITKLVVSNSDDTTTVNESVDPEGLNYIPENDTQITEQAHVSNQTTRYNTLL